MATTKEMKKNVFLLLLICFSGTVEATYNRIISLAPAVTEELYLLGAGNDIVGVTTYCDYPDSAKQKEKIGTYLEPNIEKIIRLKPDLILATKEGQKEDLVVRMKKYGLYVYTLDPCSNYREISAQFLQLGKLLGKEARAKKLLDSLNKRTAAVTRKTKKAPRTTVFWQIGTEPLMTIAKNTFPDEIITLAGGINIAHESPVRYPRYNREEVVRQNPDVFILTAMGESTDAEKKEWGKYTDLKAVKNTRIFILDARRTCNPTPVNFVEALEMTAKILHPELFK